MKTKTEVQKKAWSKSMTCLEMTKLCKQWEMTHINKALDIDQEDMLASNAQFHTHTQKGTTKELLGQR